MTISEVCHIQDDDLASPFKFYPAEIRVPHHQLRNFISVVHDKRIYYVHDHDIFVLDLETQRKSLVATVPFEARCLAAAHGWVCVGGELKGDCAFIRIAADAVEGCYLGLDLIVDMLGTEIVNSMTIHKLPAKSSDLEDEVVVLISNNDHSVTLYSPSQQQVLAVLKHPMSMNYATMSPDHTTIAAIGDSDEVYFYRCKETENSISSGTRLGRYSECDWQKFAVPKIPAGDGIPEDYGFAVTFSPNGRLCAVSAQGGHISIIAMDILLQNPSQPGKAVTHTFKSSRPGLLGCVRSMAFSPDPWDMLAWTEDHGRIGIADLRRSFITRQCLSLKPEDADTVLVSDVTPAEYQNLDVKERLKQQQLHRIRHFRGQVPAGARSLEDSQRQQTNSGTYSYTQGMDLDPNERSVLEALETTMDDVGHHTSRPYSVNYTSSPSIRPSASSASGREYEVQLLNPRTHLHVPRRRSSVVLTENVTDQNLAPPDNVRAVMTASPVPMSEDNSSPPMSTNDLTPSHSSTSQPMPYNIPPSDPWHVIEAAFVTNRDSQAARPRVTPDSPAGLARIESAILAERRITDRLERQLMDERRLSVLLRTELEMRERFLAARQQDPELQRIAEVQLSPSIERVLQRQLQTEQENGRQRSSELETEMRNNTQRVERLISEREALLNQLTRRPTGGSQISAESSALPTMSTSRINTQALDSVLRNMEGEQHARRQRIQDLETQVRQAESRVELASTHSGAERPEQRDRQHERLLDARFLSAGRSGTSADTFRRLHSSGSNGSVSTSSQSLTAGRIRGAAFRRAEAAMNADRASSIPSSSELSGRVTDNEMRLARIMLQRAAMDANGNWMANHGLARILGSRRMMGSSSAVASIGTANLRASLEEVMRDSGVGTAGIGWSPDGRYLFVGSEVGIFQFKTHIKARMCFPSSEMR